MAVKNVWPLVKGEQVLREYLPSEEMDKNYFPDKIYFWDIAFTVYGGWPQEYYQSVLKLRTGTLVPRKFAH